MRELCIIAGLRTPMLQASLAPQSYCLCKDGLAYLPAARYSSLISRSELLHASQGEIQILGQTRHGLLADDPALAEQLKLGMVFQNGALFDSLSVGENVGFQLYEHTRMSPPRVSVSTPGCDLHSSWWGVRSQGCFQGTCASWWPWQHYLSSLRGADVC